MAKTYHLNTSNDFTAAANWSLGAAPVDTNEVVIERGSEFDLTGNLDQRSVADIDLASLHIGGTFSKSIHNGLSNALMLDDVTTLEVETSGPFEQIIVLDIDGLTTGTVRRTGSNPLALYLLDGAISGSLNISSGNVTLGAGLTISGDLVITSESDGRPPPTVRILSGCTITGAIHQDAGKVESLAAIGASATYMSGTAIFKQYGGSTVNITNTVFLSGAAQLWVATTAATTIGKVDCTDNAFVDSTLSQQPITYTNSRARSRSNIKSKLNVDIFTNPTVYVGGTGTASGTVLIPGK